MEIAEIRKKLGLENFDPEEIDRIKLLLQRINDTIEGGLRSANLKEYRNTYVINAQDSLDSTYPMYVHFNIISEMVKIISIKLSFWLLPFRSYSKAGSAQGTPSGGGDTSGSGGGQTSSSVSTPSGGGSTSGGQGSASGGGATSGAGGGQTSSYVATPSGGGATTGTKDSEHRHDISVANGTQGNTVTIYNGSLLFATGGGTIRSEYKSINHFHTTPNHTHPSHAHTVANHQHTTPNHTHPTHYHTTPNHTHPAHDHTVADHTHSTPDHTHPNHTHSAVYGIFEEETSPTIMVYISRDNGLTYSLPVGSYTNDQETLDITRFIDTKGSKMIKFTSNTRARLSVQIEIKLDIKAR